MQQPKNAEDMFYSGRADDAERLILDQLSEVLAAPEDQIDHERVVRLKINLVVLHAARDQFDEAFQELDEVNRLIEQTSVSGVKALEPFAYFTRAQICYTAKLNEDARTWAERALQVLDLLEGQNRMELEQRINHMLARYYCRVMDFTQAMKYAQQIFPPGRVDEETVVRKEREAKIKALLGQIQRETAIDMLNRGQDDYEEVLRMARSFHLDARDLYRSLGLRRSEYYQLVVLAEVNLHLRYYEDAKIQLEEALEMAKSMSQDQLVEMDIAERYSTYHLVLREVDKALDWMNKSLRKAVSIGDACLSDLILRLRQTTSREGIDEAIQGLEKLIADLPPVAKSQH